MQVSEFGEYGYPIVLFINDDAKMQVCEFGEHDKPAVLYLSDQQDKDAIRAQLSRWGGEFHIIAPVFIGKKDRQTTKKQAELIAQYLKSRYQGKVYAVCGFEKSWEILDLVLKDPQITSQKTIVEAESGTPGHLMERMLQHK